MILVRLKIKQTQNHPPYCVYVSLASIMQIFIVNGDVGLMCQEDGEYYVLDPEMGCLDDVAGYIESHANVRNGESRPEWTTDK